MTPADVLLQADADLREIEEDLRVLLEEDSETGDWVRPEAEPVHCVVKLLESARRTLERARREQRREPARLVGVTSYKRESC